MPGGPSKPGAGGARRASAATVGLVLALATLSVLARLPFVVRPLSPDEGGFLMVAAQWGPGASLYGNYWVDRPPLLITLFSLAHHLGGLADQGSGVGGAVALRLVGAACVGTSVLLAAALARAVVRLDRGAGHVSARLSRFVVVGAAATAATFLVSPMFGAGEVDGEILAVPFVLAGLTAAFRAYASVRSAGRSGAGSAAWWATAGVLAVAAGGVKQNMLEVFVAVGVLLVATSRRSPRAAIGAAAAFGAGVVAGAAALLGWAAWHGTPPAGIWDAVVTFRFQAAAVIAHGAPGTARVRGLGVAGAFVTTGALGVVVAAFVPGRRGRSAGRPGALLAATAAVLVWEGIGVVGGGSYWLHYLIGTVPGLVLAAVTVALRGRRRALGAVVAYAAVVSTVAVTTTAFAAAGAPSASTTVEHYLATHARAGDTGVVGFGDPALLEAAHLPSPYPQLWSLPVRVRDPHLSDLNALLEGPRRPTWIVVDGDSLASWGIDASLAQPVLEREYRQVRTVDDWHVYHVRPS